MDIGFYFQILTPPCSERAGKAGNRQWGLDVGDHQDGWDVYAGLPEHWNHGDGADSEGETEVKKPRWPS